MSSWKSMWTFWPNAISTGLNAFCFTRAIQSFGARVFVKTLPISRPRPPRDLRSEIDVDFLAKCDLDRVERVLFHTRNSKFWSEGFRKDFTHLSPEAAERLEI